MYQQKGVRAFPLLALLLITIVALGEGTTITAPKNKYKPSDDVKLGREAAAEVSRQMPLLPEDGDVDSYVERVGQGLAAAIPAEFSHAEFHYDFSVVNASDINAFALPGGPMFVNRGMIEAAHSEGEMAGVMAHEISHVALRHGTAQATKAGSAGLQIGQLGGAILGSILGGNVGSIVAQGTQLGLGTYMLKFSREYETQADVLGAQIMARAGYDPMDLARMFKTIEEQGGSGGPQWLSDHPNPGNRYNRIQEESSKLTVAPGRNKQSAEFAQAQASLKRLPPARTGAEIEKSAPKGGNAPNTPNTPISQNVEPPSDRYRTFEASRLFKIAVPDNWKEFEGGASVTFAPNGAYGNHQGQSVFTHGAIVGVENAPSGDLNQVTDQYISGILQGNTYLKPDGKYQKERLGNRDALSRRLSGMSSVTNRKEIVDVHTALMGGGQLFYLVEVVPGNEQDRYQRAFDEMEKSVAFANP